MDKVRLISKSSPGYYINLSKMSEQLQLGMAEMMNKGINEGVIDKMEKIIEHVELINKLREENKKLREYAWAGVLSWRMHFGKDFKLPEALKMVEEGLKEMEER